MSDITPLLAELLKKYDARLNASRCRASDTEDTFLREAYRIVRPIISHPSFPQLHEPNRPDPTDPYFSFHQQNAHISSLHNYLISIRRPYLSNAPSSRRPLSSQKPPSTITTLTNPQRDQIDTETKSVLSTLAGSIQQLITAERLRQDTEREILRRKRGGALRRWANGDMADPIHEREEERMKTTGAWRESVVWYLGRKLEEAGEVQRGMVEKRVERELEKSRSVLHMRRGSLAAASMSDNTRGGGESPTSPKKWTGEEGGPMMNGGISKSWRANALPPAELAEISESLTPEQLQLFAEENNELLRHYNDTLSQVRTAQSSLLDISSLQTQLAQSLDIQSAHIQQLVTDSLNTSDNVASGNKELKKAAERRSAARDVFYATCGLCVTLVVWDLIF